jgi:hypothetical protein
MNLQESIEQSFLFLEQTYNITYSNKTATKEKLIQAFSQTSVSPSSYLGYKTANGLSKAMSRLFILEKPNKLPGQEWRDWLLGNIGIFLCKTCESTYNIFDKYSSSKNICKNCDINKSVDRRKSNRKALYEYLLAHPCVDCLESNPVVLEFDHLDPSNKLYNISNMMSNSWAKIKIEIDKCEVVCANCHRKRTAKAYNWYNF